jgi:hypothetical protein
MNNNTNKNTSIALALSAQIHDNSIENYSPSSSSLKRAESSSPTLGGSTLKKMVTRLDSNLLESIDHKPIVEVLFTNENHSYDDDEEI